MDDTTHDDTTVSEAVADAALEGVYELASLVRLTQREIVRLSELEHTLTQATPAAALRLRVIGDAAALGAAVILTTAVVTAPAREAR